MTAPIAFIIAGSGFWLAAALSTDLPSALLYGATGIVLFGIGMAFALAGVAE